MPNNNHLLSNAILLSRQGKKLDARLVLEKILESDPTNQIAWLWYADALDSPPQRLRTLERALQAHPEMDQVQKACSTIRSRLPVEAATIPPHSPLKPPSSATTSQIAQTKTLPSSPEVTEIDAPQKTLPPKILQAVPQTVRQTHQVIRQSSPIKAIPTTNIAPPQRGANQVLPWVLTAALVLIISASTFIYAITSYDLYESNRLLTQERDVLKDSQALAQSELDEKDAEYQQIQGDYNTLLEDNQKLQKKYAELSIQEQALSASYRELKKIAILPPYITVKQRTITLAFYGTDNKLIQWDVPFENLEHDITRGFASRNGLLDVAKPVVLKNSAGKKFNTNDFSGYVDKSAFENVIPDLYQDNPNEETFIREVWNIVSQLTNYVDEKIETPRFPMETLLSGGGDCEDTAILMASMIKAAPTDWTVSLVYIDASNPTKPATVNHVIVSIKTPKKVYLIETTSHTEMEPYSEINGWWFDL